MQSERHAPRQFHHRRRFAGEIFRVEDDEARVHRCKIGGEGEDIARLLLAPSRPRRKDGFADRLAREARRLGRSPREVKRSNSSKEPPLSAGETRCETIA